MGAHEPGRRPALRPGALTSQGPRVVRVLPDEPAIDKTFDYLVPDAVGDQVRVGTRVRIELHGRRVGGWVVADEVAPPAGVTLRPLAKVSGWGPPEELIDLARWAAWRWAGRPASFLRTADPPRVVTHLPPAGPRSHLGARVAGSVATGWDDLAARALAEERAVVRLPPGADRLPVVRAALARGHALVLVPAHHDARRLAVRLRREGWEVALHPDEWSRARAGASVVGTRSAAWAPVADPAAVVVLDEHDEVWQQEQAPTWHARDVVRERARRAGVPCVLVSPCPTLEALDWGTLVEPDRTVERDGWPVLDVVDRADEDPLRPGLFSDRLVRLVRDGCRVVCVLNRKGRAALLACRTCGHLAGCERCDGAVGLVDGARGPELVCSRCSQQRPVLCLHCHGTDLRRRRLGVTRAREDLEALAREPVVEVTGASGEGPVPDARLYVGTEAVLHRVARADVVAFLDFDQELLAPRYRAAEEALALLVRAARLVGSRRRPGHGRVLVQTALPDHEVVQAVLHGDPARVARAERARREAMAYPPVTAMAVASGAGAPAFVDALGSPLGVEVLGPADGRWLLRAADHAPLLDALAATPRPPGRLRIEVDPLRL